MAKHLVKCLYCSETFDANQEEFIQIKRRYAHKNCYEAAGCQPPPPAKRKTTTKAKSSAPKQEDPDLKALKDYIQQLFGDNANWAMITKQIKTYREENGYSYSGILKSLIFFYEVKHGSREKANGAIGIVPFTYQAAYNYYLDIFLANQQNENKDFVQTIKEYSIRPPKMRGTKRRLFNLGGEDEKQ